MKKILVLIVLIGVSALVLFSWLFHIVNSNDGLHIVRKKEASFSHTYIDATEWGAVDYIKYPNISKALLANKWQSIKKSTQQSINELWNKADNALESLARELEQSDRAAQEIQKLKKSFQKEWNTLQEKIRTSQDQEKIEELKKEAEKLFQRLKSEISKLQKEYNQM